MTSTRDRDLVGAVRGGTATGVLEADGPAAVAAEVAGAPNVVVVDPDDLPCAVAAARVRLATLVVDRARHAEEARGVGPASAEEAAPLGDEPDGADADRQAVRFALVILVLALPAGLAVYAVDGLVLAPALPAAALLALGVVVLVHRRPGGTAPVPGPVVVVPAGPPVGIDEAPAVRAAEAHLRRQQAAWKVSWWARDEPVPDLDRWSAEMVGGAPITLVVVDDERSVDAGAHATMTATAPAAVHVVVLQARA